MLESDPIFKFTDNISPPALLNTLYPYRTTLIFAAVFLPYRRSQGKKGIVIALVSESRKQQPWKLLVGGKLWRRRVDLHPCRSSAECRYQNVVLTDCC